MADTEAKLWLDIKPDLRGWWQRLETTTPNGLPDCIGLYAGHAQFLELKIGKPSINALRASQHNFFIECQRHDVEAWVLFRHRGVLKWFRGPTIGDPCVPPPFYRP